MTAIESTGKRAATSYDGVAVVLHWLIFLFIVGLFTTGQIAESLEEQVKSLQALASTPMLADQIKTLTASRGELMNMHKAVGVIVFVLIATRIAWRFTRGAPEPVETTPLLGLIAKAAHGLLYLLLIIMPVSGFLMSQYAGRGVPLLGIPSFLEKSPEQAQQFSAIHGLAMDAILVIVLLHAGAALWHHYVKRDETLGRMVPWLRGRRAA